MRDEQLRELIAAASAGDAEARVELAGWRLRTGQFEQAFWEVAGDLALIPERDLPDSIRGALGTFWSVVYSDGDGEPTSLGTYPSERAARVDLASHLVEQGRERYRMGAGDDEGDRDVAEAVEALFDEGDYEGAIALYERAWGHSYDVVESPIWTGA